MQWSRKRLVNVSPRRGEYLEIGLKLERNSLFPNFNKPWNAAAKDCQYKNKKIDWFQFSTIKVGQLMKVLEEAVKFKY